MRHLACLVILFIGTGTVFAESIPASQRDKDLIVTSDGRKHFVYIDSETHEGLVYRQLASAPNQEVKRWSQVQRFEYVEQRGAGTWSVLQQARKGGEYLDAAVRAQQLSTGPREWMRVYGYLAEGEAWELLGQWERAAEAFGKLAVAEDLRGNRFYMDGLYRQGVALARLKRVKEAEVRVQALLAYAGEYEKSERLVHNRAKVRARAVECAILAASGQVRDAVDAAFKIAPDSKDQDFEFHWGHFWAGFLREIGKYDEAAKQYAALLGRVEDPAARAVLSLGRGICLAEKGEKQEALIELLKLDALPYGSPEQRLEARFYSARIKWELSQKLSASDDEKKAEFGEAEARDARAMLKAVAGASVDSPYKEKAIAFLETLPPDPDAPPEAPAEEEAAAVGAAAEAAGAPPGP